MPRQSGHRRRCTSRLDRNHLSFALEPYPVSSLVSDNGHVLSDQRSNKRPSLTRSRCPLPDTLFSARSRTLLPPQLFPSPTMEISLAPPWVSNRDHLALREVWLSCPPILSGQWRL